MNGTVTQEHQTALPRFYLINKRIETNVSVDEISKKLGIGRKHYYNIESGNRGQRLSMPQLIGLITHLQFDPVEFLEQEANYQKERKGYKK